MVASTQSLSILLVLFPRYASEVQAVETHDYIVVGAGSAGSTLAGKLAKAGKSVHLLEAGPDDDWKGTDVAGNLADPNNVDDFWALQYAPEIDDAVMSEPVWQIGRSNRDPRLANITSLIGPLAKYQEFMPRARIVGGCSMHNYMFWYRGSPEVYDSWGETWSWDTLFPKFKAFETDLEPHVDPAYHGTMGANRVTSREKWLAPCHKAFIEAGIKAGYPPNDDFNGASLVGIGPSPTSSFESRRWSASKAFLTPEVRSLPNFKLTTGAMVLQVLFNGNKAVGVIYSTRDGKNHKVFASKEIILSAGAFRSPQLLMLSGVGPKEVLHEFGIPVVAESKGVGRNLQDHVMVPVTARVPFGKNQTLNNTSYAPHGGYFFSSWCKENNCSYHDLQWMCANTASEQPNVSSYTCMVALVGHFQSNPGFLTLRSRNPNEYPAIFPNYLGAEIDVARLVYGMKETCCIYRMDPDMFGPHPDVRGKWTCDGTLPDEDFIWEVNARATTLYHPVGSCKMGPSDDEMAVVDAALRVRGVQGLRVADASIMPVITNVNTDAPSRMIGFHVADMILNEDAWHRSDYTEIIF